MLLLIVLFPFLGFLLSFVFGKYLGAKGVAYVTISFLFISFLLSFYSFFLVAFSQKVFIYNVFSWFSSALIFADLGFYV